MIENGQDSSDCVMDCDALWSTPDPVESACVTFEFKIPKQQFTKFLKSPKDDHLPEVGAAPRNFGKELVFSELNAEDKERIRAFQEG